MSRVVFQAVDWAEDDVATDAEDPASKERVVVTVYGRCVDGAVVHARLHGFKPTLLIKGGKKYSAAVFAAADLPDQDLARTKLRDLNGYHPEPTVFTVSKFDTAQAFCTARRKLKDVGVPLYNCRLQPFMQLVHKSGVSTSGWVSLPGSAGGDGLVELEADWTELAHVPGAEAPAPMAPFVVTSYDIECYSATGDFPAAIKGYNKLGRETVRYMDSLRANSTADAFSWMEAAVKTSLRGLEGELSPCVVAAGQPPIDDETLRHSLFGDLFDMMRQAKWDTSTATDKIARVTAKLNSLTNRGFSESLKVAAAAAGSAVAKAYVACMDSGVGDESTTVMRGVHAGKDAAPWVPPTCIEDMAKAALKGAQTAHRNSGNADDLREQISSKAERYAASQAQRCELPWVTPPLPRLEGDPVIQIGMTTRTGNDPDMQKCVLVLGTCGPIEGVDVRTFDDEASLLKAFAAEIRRLDPDFVTGYNIMGFDFKYLRDRAEELRIPDSDMEMGRSVQERTSRNPMFVEKRLVSAAYGDNTLRFYDMPGRVVFDLMKVVQREHKLSSYKLDAVAQHFTGDKKDDLTPADIFRMHAQGPDERATVARYCVQDCMLVSDLVQKLNTLPNAIGMADVCLVPVSYIFLRGQGCKILSLVAKRCRLDGFALPELRRQEAEGYDGAFVLNPRIGVYLDTPVAVLDFASLYPSSMIATNLSHDTMLADDQPNPEGLEVEAVSFVLRDKAGNEREVTKRFVQAGPNDEHEGVLPRTLKLLLNSRASVRKAMKTVSDPFQRAVMDGLQLAYKVTANSLYGQLGSATSDICCVEIAASTTAVGRSMLIKLKDFVENERQGEVVYGDSVAGYTPVFVRHRGEIMLMTVEDVAARIGGGAWAPCVEDGKQDKEHLEFGGELEIWSDVGWTTAHRLIRHRLAPHKRMLRVTTHTGVVDVTDDHSLLRSDASIVKPNELVVGDRLMHADLPEFECVPGVCEDEARIMGYFMGDGSCGVYTECKHGTKSSWALNNNDMERQRMYKELCERAYPDLSWVILDTLKSSGVYKLVPKGQGIKAFVEEYRKKMYYDKSKIVPIEILRSPEVVRRAFWQGLYDADGDKDVNGYTRIDQKNQVSAAGIFALGSSLGYNVSVNTRADKHSITRLTMTMGKQRRAADAVKKITELPDYADGFVYDFTTDNHHFSAGVGLIVVSNTDSVMITFPRTCQVVTGKDALGATIEAAQACSEEFRKTIKKPHNAEFEYVGWPFILISKKRYVTNVYHTDPNAKPKQKFMGVVLSRRDNAAIVKKIYGGVIDRLLNGADVTGAAAFVKQAMAELVAGNVPMSDLVVSKNLGGEYADPDRIAHAVLARRMEERDPGSAPAVGDRVPYVYIVPPGGHVKGTLQGDRIEHPDHLNGAQLDFEHYISCQVMKPVAQIFSLMVHDLPGCKITREAMDAMHVVHLNECGGDVEKARRKDDAVKMKEVIRLIFEDSLKECERRRMGVKDIWSYF